MKSLYALLLLPTLALGGPTATWTPHTYAQLADGDASFAVVTSLGELQPGWAVDRTALKTDGVWSVLRRSDGSLLIGSDDEGALLQVNGATIKRLASVPGAIAIVALAAQGNDALLGAMPSKTLWRLRNGKITPVVELKDVETIWAIAVGTDGTAYVGTGPSGVLYAVKNGKASEVFRTEDKRVSAVAVAPDGAVWFGTGERAVVFRYDPKANETRAMADFAGNEISSIVVTKDAAFVAANDVEQPTGPAKTATQVAAIEKPKAPKGDDAKAPTKGSVPGAEEEKELTGERKGARKGKGAVFRIDNDGRLLQLHALTSTYFTSIAVGADGAVYGASADKGRVYVMQHRSVGTAFDVDERAVSHLFWDGDKLGLATDDSAAVYRTKGRASDAKYVSEVFDAKGISQLGRMTWLGTGRVSVETRSGNTATPGPGWSKWQGVSGLGKLPNGLATGKVASPAGRYLQYRVALPTADSTFRQATLYYVPQNTGTVLSDLVIEPVTKEPLTTLKDLAAKPRSPLLKIKWKSENPDGDETEYQLAVQREGETAWRALATGKAPLTATQWEWNTETFADGLYRVRVSAHDGLANPLERIQRDTLISTVIAVDNERPSLQLTIKGSAVSARAVDALSILSDAAVSFDDGPWQLLGPTDGLFDDTTETFTVTAPAGAQSVAVRVSDAGTNVASQTIWVKR